MGQQLAVMRGIVGWFMAHLNMTGSPTLLKQATVWAYLLCGMIVWLGMRFSCFVAH